MSNAGAFSSEDLPTWDANIFQGLIRQHPEVLYPVSQQPPRAMLALLPPQSGRLDSAPPNVFIPYQVEDRPGDIQLSDEDGYLSGQAIPEHSAPFAMDGHTPPHFGHLLSGFTSSPDSNSTPTGIAPMVSNMVPHGSTPGRGSTSPGPQAIINGPVYIPRQYPHQPFAMPHEVLQQPQAAGRIYSQVKYSLAEAHRTLSGAHLTPPSTFLPSPGGEPMPAGTAMFPHAMTIGIPIVNVNSVGSEGHNTHGTGDQISVSSGMPSRNDLTGFSQLGEQHQQPTTAYDSSQQLQALTRQTLAAKSPKSPKSGTDAAGMQPPLKLGPKVAPSEHPPQHEINSSMRTFKQSGNHEGLVEHVPSKTSKRKANQAGDDAEDDGVRKRAKQLAEDSDAEADFASDILPKQSSAKGRSAKLAAVAKVTLPDYGSTVLSFENRDAAISSLQDRLDSIKDAFLSADQDDSIPENDDQIQDAVKRLLGAMKDLTGAKDLASRGVKSRWLDGAKHPYSDEVMETTCWSIIDLCIKLHREGPSALSIGDPHYLPQIKKSAHLTFEQRVKTIAILIREWKARNDGLIKGDTLQTVVAAPLEALLSASNNAGANKARADLLKIGQEHRPPGQGRKRKAAEDTPEDTPKSQTRKRKQPKKRMGLFDGSTTAAGDALAGGNEAAVDGAVEAEQALVSNDAATLEDAAMSDGEDDVVSVPEE